MKSEKPRGLALAVGTGEKRRVWILPPLGDH